MSEKKKSYRELVQKCLDFINDRHNDTSGGFIPRTERFRSEILEALLNSPVGNDIERDAGTNNLILDDM